MFCLPPDLDKALLEIGPQIPRDTDDAAQMVLDLLAGKAQLLLCEDGWVVVYIGVEGTKKLLWIWAAYAKGQAWDKYMPELEKIALEHGCEQVGFNTKRRGFSRKLRGTGYAPSAIEYRKTLNVKGKEA